MTGVDGKVVIATELDTKDAEKSAQGLSGKLQNGLAKGVKAVGVGLATMGASAVASAGAVVKSSLEAYASYEQLVGGVETLFGAGGKNLDQYAKSVGKTTKEVEGKYNSLMKAQDTVLKNSERAYKTAGMSANEYMETVTSFSASLIQGLKGDTEKASKKANKAIVDMSDNANKMGTSMEMIQNAYQGFAKQNYTMLDNLKLGYGGTASEMARLVKDSGVLGDQAKDLTAKNLNEKVSFDQIVDAIHKVQTNMGITGTTSKEASTTIEGSINSMKASWENLLTSLGDKNQDTRKKVKEFTKSVETVIKNVLPVAEQVLKGMSDTVSRLAPTFLKKIPPLIEKFLPKFLSAGTSIIKAIVQGLAKAIPTLIKMLPKIVSVLSGALKEALNVIGQELPSAFRPLASILGTVVDLFGGFVKLVTSSSTAGEVLRTIIYGIVTAYVAYKVAVGIATLYTKLLTIAMNTNPVILLITAITGLIGVLMAFASTTEDTQEIVTEEGKRAEQTAKHYDEFTKKLKENAEARKETSESAEAETIQIDNLYSRLKELNKVEHKNKTQKQEMHSIVKQLNELVPDLNLKYDEESDKLSKSTGEIKKNIKARKDQIMQDAIYESAKSISKDKAEAQRELNSLVKEGTRLKQRENEINQEEEKWYAQLDKYYDKKTDTWNTQAKGYKEAQKHLQELSREYSDELLPAMEKNSEQTDDAKKKINGLNTELDQTYQQATNIQKIGVFKKLVKDAEEAGVKVPQVLKDQFEAGAITIKEATTRLENSAKIKNLNKNAKGEAQKTVDSIVSQYLSGTISAKEASKQLRDAGLQGLEGGKGKAKKHAEEKTDAFSDETKSDKAKKKANKSGQAVRDEAVKGLGKKDPSNNEKTKATNFIDGFLNVFKTGKTYSKVDTILGGFVGYVLGAMGKAGGEGSPWKTTKQKGIWAVEGFVEGIESKQVDADKAMSNIAYSSVNSLNRQLQASTQFSAGTLQTAISHSVDLRSNISNAVQEGFENANVEMKVGERDFARLTKGALA